MLFTFTPPADTAESFPVCDVPQDTVFQVYEVGHQTIVSLRRGSIARCPSSTWNLLYIYSQRSPALPQTHQKARETQLSRGESPTVANMSPNLDIRFNTAPQIARMSIFPDILIPKITKMRISTHNLGKRPLDQTANCLQD